MGLPKSQPQDESQVLAFSTKAAWADWLAQHHANPMGVWLRFFKKGSGVRSVTYAEALDEALCYGWIDGQLRRGDEQSYIQRFTPRRNRSIWSKRNIEHVARLTAEGRMQPAGLKEVAVAKADGRWAAAYDSPSKMSVPDDFTAALEKNQRARDFFATLNKANIYAIAWRLQTAKKPETRARRMETILKMLARREKFH